MTTPSQTETLVSPDIRNYISNDEFDADKFYADELGIDGAGPEAKQRRNAANNYYLNQAKAKQRQKTAASDLPKALQTKVYEGQQRVGQINSSISELTRAMGSIDHMPNGMVANWGLKAKDAVGQTSPEEAEAIQAAQLFGVGALEKYSALIKLMSQDDRTFVTGVFNDPNASRDRRNKAARMLIRQSQLEAQQITRDINSVRDGSYMDVDLDGTAPEYKATPLDELLGVLDSNPDIAADINADLRAGVRPEQILRQLREMNAGGPQ